jgi:hypothetical protein
MFGWKKMVEQSKQFEERMSDISKHNPGIPYELIREVSLDIASKSPRSILDIPEYEIICEVIKRRQ